MEISQEIIEVFDYLGGKLGIAIDWSSDNVLPYIEELIGRYINFEITTSILWMFIGVAISVTGFILYKKLKCDFFDVDAVVFEIMVVLGIAIFFWQIHDIIKCVYLPELRIYEYILESWFY